MVDFIIDCVYEAIAKSESDDGNDSTIAMTTVTPKITTTTTNSLLDVNDINDSVFDEDNAVNAIEVDRGDEYILDSYILCSCNGDASRRAAKNTILRHDTFRTTYDRHGDIQRTSSRRVTRKIFRRCSFCAGRVLVVTHSDAEDDVSENDVIKSPPMTSPTSSTNEGTIESSCSGDVTLEIIPLASINTSHHEGNDSKINDNINSDEIITKENNDNSDIIVGKKNDENEQCFDRSQLKKLNLVAPPALVVNSPSPPPPSSSALPVSSLQKTTSPPIDMPSPGILNHYTSEGQPLVASPTTAAADGGANNGAFYQAGSLMRQSKYEISTRTSQLVEHTPSRLHTFFAHVLRKRNHGHKHNNHHSNSSQQNGGSSGNHHYSVSSDDRRGSRKNLHRIFHFTSSSSGGSSSSPKSLSPATCNYQRPATLSTSPPGVSVGGGGGTDQAPNNGGRRRFTFGRTLKVSQREYTNRRKSMPIQLYRRRGSSVYESPDVNNTEQCQIPVGSHDSQSKSYSALSSVDGTPEQRTRQSRNSFVSTLRRNKKTKSHDALNQSDSQLEGIGQSAGRTTSHDSLLDQSESVIMFPSSPDQGVVKPSSKKSRSLLNLFRKKNSH